jgi:hypothetical protein
MTKDEVIELLSEHFTEGMVRTIIDNLVAHEREECAKLCDESEYPDGFDLANLIRERGK